MPLPTLKCEVAFTTNPLNEPSWTDISSFLKSFSSRRGRQGDLGRWEAGTEVVVLKNLDRRFEPYYLLSPYAPNVLPRKRIRVRALVGSTSYPIFDGFVDDWIPSYPESGAKDATCTVRATDGFKIFANAQLHYPYVNEVLKDLQTPLDPKVAYYRFGELTPSPPPLGVGEVFITQAADSSGYGNNGKFYGDSGDAILFGVGDPLTTDEDGAIYCIGSKSGQIQAAKPVAYSEPITGLSVEFWIKTTQTTSALVVMQADPTANTTSWAFELNTTPNKLTFNLNPTSQISVANVNDDLWHHIVGTYDRATGAQKFYFDGGLVDSDLVAKTFSAATHRLLVAGGSFLPGSDFDGSLDELAFYRHALPADQVLAHYLARTSLKNQWSDARVGWVCDSVGWPRGDKDFDYGRVKLVDAGDVEGKSALDHLREIDATEAGALFISREGKITFRSRYAPLGAVARSSVVQTHFGSGGVRYQSIVLSGDDEDLANSIEVRRRKGITASAQSKASQTKYGTISKSISSIATSDEEAQDLSDWLLTHLADANRLRIRSLAFILTEDVVLQAALLSKELHDRVRVSFAPPGGGVPIDQEALITAIEWNIVAGLWQMGVSISPTETLAFWKWGTDDWNSNTKWGFERQVPRTTLSWAWGSGTWNTSTAWD